MTPTGGSITMFSTTACASVVKSEVETKPHSANAGVVAVATAFPCHPPTGAVWRE